MPQRSVRPKGHEPGLLAVPFQGPGDGSPPLGGTCRPAACPVNDGTMCREVSYRPGPTRAVSRLATMTAGERLLEAMRRAVPLLPAEMRDEFLELLAPANLALTGGVLALWAGAHAFGVGEAVDVVLLVAGGLFLGASVFRAAGELARFVRVGAGATSESEADEAARHLARFVSIVGAATCVAVVMKAAGKAAPRRLSGLVEEPGGGTSIPKGDKFWEASDFGPDIPGTSVPQSFTLRVAGREFVIKGTHDTIKGARGATKHMAEYAAKNATAGARYSEVAYPLSSLAAALEQVERRGELAPLLRGQVTRLGTETAPHVTGGWELSFELKDGRVEVLHAVPKQK
jgi:hypothetical protein